MLGTGLLHHLPPPSPNPWECLGHQGVLAGSAGGEYQHILEYIYALIKRKTYTEKSLIYLLTSPHCTAVFLPFNRCLCYCCSKAYAACRWKQTFLLEERIVLQLPAGDRTTELL